MKRLYSTIFMLSMMIVALSFTACGGQKDGSASSEDEIKQRIEEIFNEVYHPTQEYNTVDALDKKYMSHDYNEVWDYAWNNCDEPFIDYNHWTQAQDSDNPSMEVKSVSKKSDYKATADIIIHAFPKSSGTPVTLVLVLEGGEWRIDDFITNGESEKEMISKAVNGTSVKQNHSNTTETVSQQVDIMPILNECQNEITSIQREIEEVCRTFAVLGSQDVDMYKYTQMKSTFLNGVSDLEGKADRAFDKCARELQEAGYPDAVAKVNEEKRQFHSAIYELTTRVSQQTDSSY